MRLKEILKNKDVEDVISEGERARSDISKNKNVQFR